MLLRLYYYTAVLVFYYITLIIQLLIAERRTTMPWNLNSDRPIFIQIIEHIEYDIVSGVLPPGAKVPSVRELASEAAVNPNTMQRALSEMERQGLMRTERTSGRYVTDDEDAIASLKKNLASLGVDGFIKQMKRLGLDRDEVLKLVKDNY